MATLIKVDRNGSKHYEGMITCDKCGGAGMIAHHVENGVPSWNWTDGGVCWKCGGSGKIHSKWIERTPEYQAKLDAKRQKKHEAEIAKQKAHADEINQAFFQQQGFNAEGKTFVVLGDTYKIRSELKDLGCKFSAILGWHTDHQIDGYQMLMVDIDDCYYKNGYDGIYRRQNWKTDVAEKIKRANKELEKPSEYIGAIGEKITVNATFDRSYSFEGYMGRTTYIYTFKDSDENILVWKTQAWQDLAKGREVQITGTVKEHSEYREQKQTVLTRCKITRKDEL